MKRPFFLFLFYFILYPFTYGQSRTFENASDYNNYLVEEQNLLITRIIDYNISNLHNNDLLENNQKRLEIIAQIESSLEKIKALAPFQGDTKLKEEALAVFNLYKEACDVEFNEINLLRKDRENSFESMQRYFMTQDKAEEKLRNAGEQFNNAQKEFAKKNKIKLKDHYKNYFEDIAKVNQYSRNVTLHYFRVSKTDAVFMDALNNQQVDLMEEKRKEIISAAETSLTSLNELNSYKSDSAYKVKAIQLVRFHQHLAMNEYQELIQIISKKGRTQADIDRYNRIVTDVNDASQKLLNELNKENKEMLKRNIPLY